jgi:hypothetical protein
MTGQHRYRAGPKIKERKRIKKKGGAADADPWYPDNNHESEK